MLIAKLVISRAETTARVAEQIDARLGIWRSSYSVFTIDFRDILSEIAQHWEDIILGKRRR